jgi:hypothetical protein
MSELIPIAILFLVAVFVEYEQDMIELGRKADRFAEGGGGCA